MTKSRKPITSMLAACVVFATMPFFSSAHGIDTLPSDTEKIVLDTATSWFAKNYEDFYDLKILDADVIKVDKGNDGLQYTVALNGETSLKQNDVHKLPFFKGLSAALSETGMTAEKQFAIDSFAKTVKTDADIGKSRGLSVDVVVTGDPKNLYVKYFEEGMEGTLIDISELKLDSDKMFWEGYNFATTALNLARGARTLGYANYNRISARDYALTYSSNASTCDVDGSSCGIAQNRNYWNTSVYPYFTLFKHNDCADFVSQAMSSGSLPEAGTWFRTKYSSGQNWGSAWTYVPDLKSYMLNKGYWDSSTYAACNAGNILLTSSSHVVMITLNDTVTHRYTAHTNDRKDYAFSNGSGYLYYTIKTS